MRLNYVSNPPTGLEAGDEAIVERIKARRGTKGLIPLDLTLLHAPKVADGCNALFAAVRTKTSLTDDILEIAICRTCLVLGAWHEWNGHVPKLLASTAFPGEGGLEIVKAVHLISPGPLNARQWAALNYADHMSRAVAVPNDVFEQLGKASLSEKEIVELTTLIGAYNMIGRVFVALDIADANEKPPQWIAQ
ncbi:hypothetical protein CKM354_000629300 [Cercospora kikuchii]|uniref:Carboxymuconolactone decarboxylase-like domain-containing protein n=1 Tax=Cercospora kikuchii TaxID=84275 RepID=A0A9P3FHM9_9PEZI|nr:uncharacterized protein CKM354_000629300 [Cercospora kikuchii]GIZ43049.1 hypothetical protein CKM354_000629300 [Cercospora kikuchii]